MNQKKDRKSGKKWQSNKKNKKEKAVKMKIHLRNIYTKPHRQKYTPKTEILTLVATLKQVFLYCNKLTHNTLRK